jgi:hypothetical protein
MNAWSARWIWTARLPLRGSRFRLEGLIRSLFPTETTSSSKCVRAAVQCQGRRAEICASRFRTLCRSELFPLTAFCTTPCFEVAPSPLDLGADAPRLHSDSLAHRLQHL